MPGRTGRKFDFFISRRGSVSAVAQEVYDVLTAKGYRVFVQDYNIPITADLIEKMHEGIKNSRDLIVLFTEDYEASPYTRLEFSSFTADLARSREERRVIVLRCQDVVPRGFFAPWVYQDLFGVDDLEERKRRIIAAAEGHSQAQKPPLRPFVGVPPRIASFTGRGEELDRLDKILIGSDKPVAITQAGVGRVAVAGMGGVGKTSLGIEYAYRFRDLYAGIWWCQAETRLGLMTSLASLAKDLGAAAADEAVERAARAGLRYLAEQRATYLLIYDNVADPDEIKDLLPAAGALVLITSRFRDWRAFAEEVSLEVLPPGEAIAFLESRSGRKNAAGAEVLAKTLGYLPLALDHAAAYLGRDRSTSFADYAAQVESLIATRPRGVDYPLSVAATFELAIAQAVKMCPAADALMAYLAYCAPERIPMALVDGAVENPTELRAARLALMEVSLVKNDPFDETTPAVTVHRLVQAVERKRAEAKEEAKAPINRLMDRLAAIYPADGYENPKSWALCTQLTPHLFALDKATLVSTAESTQWSGLLNRTGNFFLGRGACREAWPLFERALAINDKALGADNPETLRTMSNIARWTARCGNPPEALRLFDALLLDQERALGPCDPDTLRTRGNVAFWTGVRGDPRQALRLFKALLPDQERVLGHDDRDTLRARGSIARWTGEAEDAREALGLYQTLLADRVRVLGPDHKDTLRTRNNIAVLTAKCGKPVEALQLFKALLPDRKRVLGADHPETLRTRGNIAAVTGDARQALALLEALVSEQQRVLGSDHRDTLTTKNNIAALTVPCGDGKPTLRLFSD